MADQIELCRQRYSDIAALIKDDENAKELLNDLNESVARYVRTVAYNIAFSKSSSMAGEGDWDVGSNQRLIERMDFNRRAAHEALISSLNSFNRYILGNKSNVPQGGIYTLEPHLIGDRMRVGDWAGYYFMALTQLNSSELA